MTPKSASHNAFTLVELSIVIVIIGLIAAAVTSGKSMLRQYTLRNIVISCEKYKTAYWNFRDTYNALPGDMVDATTAWGTGGTGTQNGNGNRKIEHTWNASDEGILAWQHLSKEGLIPQKFQGAISWTQAGLKSALPMASNDNIAYYLLTQTSPALFGNYGDLILVGSIVDINGGSTWRPWGPIVNAVEAQKLDIKIDDGLPNKGSLYTIEADYPGVTKGVDCVTADWTVTGSSTAVSYRNNTNKACRFGFWIGAK